MNSPLFFQSSFNRPNLIYEVRQKEKGDKWVADMALWIKKNYIKKSGIIYCQSTKKCESLA